MKNIYINIFIYIFFIEEKKCFCFENDKNDFDKNDTLPLL